MIYCIRLYIFFTLLFDKIKLLNGKYSSVFPFVTLEGPLKAVLALKDYPPNVKYIKWNEIKMK